MRREISPKILAARVRLQRDKPYLSAALWRVAIVPSTEVRTLSVSMNWVLYYNEEYVAQLPMRNLVAVFEHEIWHLLRRHHERVRNIRGVAYGYDLGNWATDLEINDDLENLPDNALLPEKFGMPPGLTMEEYVALAEKERENEKSARRGSSGEEEEQNDGAQTSGGGAQSPESGAQSPQGGAQSPQGDAQSSEGGAQSPESGAQSPQGGAASSPSSSGDTPPWKSVPFGGGSGSDGKPKPWETAPEEETNRPSAAEAEKIVMTVAVNILQRSRGDGASNMERWAKATVIPASSVLRRLVNMRARLERGKKKRRTYSRPSRRWTERVILPGKKSSGVKAALVLDTSGSMGDEDLGKGLAAAKVLIKHAAELTVYSGDARVNTVQRSVTNANKIRLVGGGGTSMRLIVTQILENKKNDYDFIVVVTDGYTDWWDPNPAIPVVALVTDDSAFVPSHVEVIRV